MKVTRIIKRYHNRKLYDTSSSTYVTLEDIAFLIKRGDEVQIFDNTTKEDITGQTLAQIIFEEEKKRKSFLPLGTLRNLIQTGGETIRELVQSEFTHVKSFVEEKVKPTIQNVQSIPVVQQELKNLKDRLETLEKKLKKKR
ncbi:MAG: polyhydroxyalkanoate synthesis regulator DNA-binding domain-containing protein [Deltaproteobacteria bacterium]|nr:polyhydroxyalkanoate synthesis regulator DNA-binding domain-containing protein [Deltaproteobacteria bacterium]MBI2974757.1 polyhydroxyalkanoate synthesis regulator DNA-binding domain-containing protein [Deltaproteobacteria bacterium]